MNLRKLIATRTRKAIVGVVGAFVALAILGSFLPDEPAPAQAAPKATHAPVHKVEATHKTKPSHKAKAAHKPAPKPTHKATHRAKPAHKAKPKHNYNTKAAKVEAVSMCEVLIKKRLVSPSSAEFMSMWDYDVNKNVRWYSKDGVYEVDGELDADNMYGATLHRSFSCDIKPGKHDTWKLTALTGPAFADIGATLF